MRQLLLLRVAPERPKRESRWPIRLPITYRTMYSSRDCFWSVELLYLGTLLTKDTVWVPCYRYLSGHLQWKIRHSYLVTKKLHCYYFGGARSKGFATLRNVSKLQFFDKIGQAKSVGFRFYSAIWRSESLINSRYLEITSISLIYSLTFSRKKELLFWLSRGLNRLTCVTRQIRGDSKLRD